MIPDPESVQVTKPDPVWRKKLVLRKETIKNLRANTSTKNAADDYPGDTASACSSTCFPDL